MKDEWKKDMWGVTDIKENKGRQLEIEVSDDEVKIKRQQETEERKEEEIGRDKQDGDDTASGCAAEMLYTYRS